MSFTWSASSNCAENRFLFCFSAASLAFQVFPPLDFKLSSYIPPPERLCCCVLTADIGGDPVRTPDAFPGPCRQAGVCLERLFAVFSCTVIQINIGWLILQQYWQISKKAVCSTGTFCWRSLSFSFAAFNQLSLKMYFQIWAFLFADIRRCSTATP